MPVSEPDRPRRLDQLRTRQMPLTVRHPIGVLRVRRARGPSYSAGVGADLREVNSSMAAKFELYTDL
ncbi:hypothetical protein ACIA8O_01040 [Kitasatospora sp. NPDC051853]|uniref:hypothetical protein n=1 Tax=Kitasatospora sp. NPDC051853 TaxID=3364058 RepID=UPI00378B8FAF